MKEKKIKNWVWLGMRITTCVFVWFCSWMCCGGDYILDGKHHMLPGSGDLYLYGVDKSDIRAAYRCRTQHRLHAAGFHQQLSANTATIAVSGK